MVRRTGTTPVRTIRIPDDLWQAAIRTARGRGEDVPDAIREFLARYAREELRAARQSKPIVTEPTPLLVDLPEDFLDYGPLEGHVGWRCRYCGKGRVFDGTVREEAAEARTHQAQCPMNPTRTAKPTEETP